MEIIIFLTDYSICSCNAMAVTVKSAVGGVVWGMNGKIQLQNFYIFIWNGTILTVWKIKGVECDS